MFNRLENHARRLFRVSVTAAVMCVVLTALFLSLLLCGLAVILLVYRFEQPLAYGLGLLLGCALSMLKVILLEKSLDKSMDMEAKNAQNYAGLQMAMRYVLTFIVLIGAIVFPKIIGLVGLIIGILSLQASAYITNHIIKKRML